MESSQVELIEDFQLSFIFVCFQVSRLLEMAIAMSSAQEKVTGNGKLDMTGIMAALALAQKEEMTNK